MQDDNGRWDPATVIGLKSNEDVLVVGNAAFMPWLNEICSDVTSARKSNDLLQLVKEQEQFSKVIFARETNVVNEMIPLAAALLKNDEFEKGTMIFIPNSDGWAEKNVVDFYFPEAIIREFDSSFGQIIAVEAPPTSWRIIHG